MLFLHTSQLSRFLEHVLAPDAGSKMGDCGKSLAAADGLVSLGPPWQRLWAMYSYKVSTQK